MSYSHNKYVDINDLVNKSYTSSQGYDSYISKHMSKEVYNSSNGYITYKNFECKKPIKISLKLTEINQHKINRKIFVYMKYDLDLIDAEGKSVSRSRNIPVVFTVLKNNNDFYIENKQEYEEGINQVPNIYK